MIEQTGDTYQTSDYAKAMFVAQAKEGKTAFMVAQALGVFPGQKFGGVVDKPENLHVITADAGALSGVQKFLTKTCGASEEALKFRIYNMQDDVRRVSASEQEYDYSLYNGFLAALRKVGERAAKGGVHVVHISSLTGFANAFERAIGGPPGSRRGGGMDQSKWSDYNRQVAEIRNFAQQDSWHCFWEAHIYKPPATGQGQDEPKESLIISGKAGHNFAYNVEQVFRIRRLMGEKVKGTNCDTVYVDTRPTMEVIANGRSFNETLDAKEYDLTVAFHKLGVKVGRWGSGSKKKQK